MTRVAGRVLEETTMTTNTQGGSATIYQFPLRGRFAAPAQQNDTSASSRVPSHAAAVAIGSAWYHDAAIDAERPRGN